MEAQRPIDTLSVAVLGDPTWIRIRPDAIIARSLWAVLHAAQTVDGPTLEAALAAGAGAGFRSAFPHAPKQSLVLLPATRAQLREVGLKALRSALNTRTSDNEVRVDVLATNTSLVDLTPFPPGPRASFLPLTTVAWAQHLGRIVGDEAARIVVLADEFWRVSKLDAIWETHLNTMVYDGPSHTGVELPMGVWWALLGLLVLLFVLVVWLSVRLWRTPGRPHRDQGEGANPQPLAADP